MGVPDTYPNPNTDHNPYADPNPNTEHTPNPNVLTLMPGGQRHCISVDADQGIVCDPALGYTSLEAFLLYESRSAPTTIASIYRVCIRTSTKRRR